MCTYQLAARIGLLLNKLKLVSEFQVHGGGQTLETPANAAATPFKSALCCSDMIIKQNSPVILN